MRTLARFLVLFALCAGIVFTAGGVAGAEEKTFTPKGGAGIPMIEGIKMLEVGSVAPDFSVKDTTGAPYTFAAGKGGKATIFVFWSIFCEPCRAEMPAVQKMHDTYKDSGLDVLAVTLDGEPLKNSIVGFVKQEGYTFRVLIDELDAKEMFIVSDPYGVAGTPTLYLVDKAGKIAFARAGALQEGELEKVVQAVLKK